MTSKEVLSIAWLMPWGPASPTERKDITQALEYEIKNGHPLFGLLANITIIARNSRRPGVLLLVSNNDARLAQVHLTGEKLNVRPPFPVTEFFPSILEWANKRMKPDHLSWLEVATEL